MLKIFLTPAIVLTLTLNVQAQQADTARIDLEEVVIAEKRIQLPYSRQSRSITVVDRQLIEQTPALSVADMLHTVSSVDVRTRGVHGIQADVGIRGGTFEQTLVLLNGVKLTDPQTGHHNFNLPVDYGSIERIEVLKGPGARTYGQNAFAGAINIITTVPDSSFLRAGIRAGDFGLWGARLAGAWVGSGQRHYLAVDYGRSDGYRYNTDYALLNSFYQGAIAVGSSELELMAGFSARSFGANGFYASPDYRDQYEAIVTGLGAVSWKTRLGAAALDVRGYYRQNNDEYLFIRSDPAFFRNYHVSRRMGVETNLVVPQTNSTTGIGVDVYTVALQSNNLGNRQRQVATLFIEHNMDLAGGRLSITPGLQANYYSDFGLNALPGLDIGYSAGRHGQVFGSVGYTYRVPTYTELYYQSPANRGNPALLPEFAMNYELGARTRGLERLSAAASLFYRQGYQIIDWVRPADTTAWSPRNLLNVDMAGVEVEGTLRLAGPGRPLSLGRSLSLNYTYIHSAYQAPESLQSRYALENLRHQLRGTLVLGYGRRLRHTVTAGYYDRVNLPDYWVVDTRLSYQGPRLRLYADITNLFDVAYRETNLVPMPGRWFSAGIEVKVF